MPRRSFTRGPTGPSQAGAGTPGPAGPTGPPGPAGAASIVPGPQGPAGPAGGVGPQGPQGIKGDTGNTGLQGTAGATGSQGPQGLPGANGAAGAQGPPGADGAAGAAGQQGIQGIQGVAGPAGPQGVAGIPPAGALGQTYPRGADAGNIAFLSTGRLQLVGIMLPTATTVTNIVFMTGTTLATGPTNHWFGLFDLNRVCLRLTANALTAAWAANSTKLLALTTPFVTTYTGLHYLGLMVAATTVPTLTGAVSSVQQNTIPPIAAGTSNTGLTTPPGLPFTANALTGAANTPYAYVT